MGSMCGSCCLSFLTLTYLGRKVAIILSNIVFSVSFTLLGGAMSWLETVLPLLMAGRTLGGVGIGLATAASVIYIAECSQSSLRGALSSLPAVFLALGNLLCYVIGKMGFNLKLKNNLKFLYNLLRGVPPLALFVLLLPLLPLLGPCCHVLSPRKPCLAYRQQQRKKCS